MDFSYFAFPLLIGWWIYGHPLLESTRRTKIASDGTRVDLTGLASISSRIRSIPGVFFWLPKTQRGTGFVGSLFVLLSLLPLSLTPALLDRYHKIDQEYVRTINAQVDRKAIQKTHNASANSDRPNQSNLLGQRNMFGLFFVVYSIPFRQIFRSGIGLLWLPIQCQGCGWRVKDWLHLTRHIPSEMSFLTGRLQFRKSNRGLYCLTILCCFIPLAVALIPCLYILCCTVPAAAGLTPFLILDWGVVPLFGLWVLSVFVLNLAVNVTQRAVMKFAPPITPIESMQQSIVYLRAFKDDSRLQLIEERIVMALMSDGRRVVALGKPGEKLPPVGAERFYVDDSAWQSVISKWLTDSHAIVMIASITDATGWEIEEVFRTSGHERCLILFVNTGRPVDDDLPNKSGRPDESGCQNELSVVVQQMYEKLKSLGVPNMDANHDWRQLNPTEVLIAVTFQSDGTPIVITSDKRDEYGFEEAIKWHLASLTNAA